MSNYFDSCSFVVRSPRSRTSERGIWARSEKLSNEIERDRTTNEMGHTHSCF
jgi:hypothetical protein